MSTEDAGRLASPLTEELGLVEKLRQAAARKWPNEADQRYSLFGQAADEIERMRQVVRYEADVVDAAKNEIDRLTAALKTANDQAEHFERAWYLRGDDLERLRAALQWLEDKARARKLEIAPSLLGTGFEFGFWPAGDARVVNAKTLLEAVEAAQRA